MSANNEKKLNQKLKKYFPGKTVSKALSRQMKGMVNVPSFVIECLISLMCSSGDTDEGMDKVRKILISNNLRSDQRQIILSQLRKKGVYTIIDHVRACLDMKHNLYTADLSSLGLKNVSIPDKYPENCSRMLAEGIWCVLQLEYKNQPFSRNSSIAITGLAPIQIPDIDLNEYQKARRNFTKEEWMDILIRSCGLEPDVLSEREKWLFLMRLVPLCESNYYLCEMGPRSTGKSFLYKELSSYSLLVSGGQTTVSNLFYNLNTRTPGLASFWDCVTFDEVAGIQIKDKEGIQIMKDYMASGSFARGREHINGHASFVFIGNIDNIPDKEDDIFSTFPTAMSQDSAFLDRFHAYLPGWEIPKLYPKHFTSGWGFVSDYLAEILRMLRGIQFGFMIEKYFQLGDSLNQRDIIAVRKTVSGLAKLVYPDGIISKNDMEELLNIAIEMRQRIKYRLHRLNPDEFKDYQLTYTEIGTDTDIDI